MVDTFPQFATVVRNNWDRMVKQEIFVIDAPRDDVWAKYLASFPEGTDPIYRTRTEHDCSCCKHFVKNVGHVISMQNGKVTTVWDNGDKLPTPYREVAEAMAEYVRGFAIANLYRSTPKHFKFGQQTSNELLENGTVKKWNHFMAEVPSKFLADNADTILGDAATTAGVFKRSLEEITQVAIDEVTDLIKNKSIYRGDEFKAGVAELRKLKLAYAKLNSETARNQFIWENIGNRSARLRNTAIGTLLQDLSAGDDLESAVRKYEAKVAPEHYKRSTALITPRMIDAALKNLRELDLEGAIDRRHARISDVSVQNVLFVDNSVRGQMRDGLADLLMESVAKAKAPTTKASEEISMDDFMKTVLPKAKSIDLYVENKHLPNFMSLTAPERPDTGNLFKWNNDFAWSYDGEVTDSIKQRVKRAGGRVDNALMRVSLAWFNTDDLDIHVREPDGNVIYFHNKCGKLDVDMNVQAFSARRDAVENVSWLRTPIDGKYEVHVDNFTRREDKDVGFDIEVESFGQTWNFNYEKSVRGKVAAVTLQVKNGHIVDIKPHAGMVVTGGTSAEKWGVTTNEFVPVDTMMLSPNHWDDQEIGNKHWFFMIKNCKNPEPVRGIYNEFLSAKLDKHRKVFEVLGAKTKCPYSDEQLSGLGFSSTRKDEVTLAVRGDKLNKTFKVIF